MKSNHLKINVPKLSGHNLELTICPGEQYFLVGKNGSGKSSLLQHIATSSPDDQKIVRVLAHRQTWLPSNALNMTPAGRKQNEEHIKSEDRYFESVWRDEYAYERISSVLFDLVSKDNARARVITEFVDRQEFQRAKYEASKSISLFDQLNTLLVTGTLNVALQDSEGEDILAKHLDSGAEFSMSQMSDGERNAAIIAATVITAPPNSLFLIDEPERHLHRSIIEPFLMSLFRHRNDCAFVISTHEIALPAASEISTTLLVRSCTWHNNTVSAWDVESIPPNSNLPEDLRVAILGSRKRILFVEGDTSGSLDLPLYDILFPDVSVIPKGSYIEVIKAVSGLREAKSLHHANAFGLIDRDSWPKSKINQISQNQIFALEVYSVEGLYYCSHAICAVAHRQAETLGREGDELIRTALEEALQSLAAHSVANKMVSHRCMQQIRNQALSEIHKLEERTIDTNETIQISIQSPLPSERELFDTLLSDRKLDTLVARYPIKKSPLPDKIARALHFPNRHDYQQALLAQVRTNSELAEKLRSRIQPLSSILA